MNSVFLTGRIAQDIELKTTQMGYSRVQFSVAEDVRAGGKEETQYINCVAWRGLADTISKYCKKGDQIIITGTLRNRTYESNGETKHIYEVMVDKFEFGAKKQTDKTTDPVESELGSVLLSDQELPF